MQKFDVAIVGGGMNGISLAAILPKELKIALVDGKNIQKIHENSYDGRNIALSSSSVEILETAGLWQNLQQFASPIRHIMVNDDQTSPVLHFDSALLENDAIGQMILADDLIRELQKEILKRENVTIFPGHFLTGIEQFNSSATLKLKAEKNEEISAKLVIGADGKFSKLREILGIKTTNKPYGQDAIICNIKHSLPHQNVAHEIFLPKGPLAILPLKNEFSSSIVLSQEKENAEIFLGDEGKKLLEIFLNKKCVFLGKIEVSSRIMSYELNLSYCEQYISKRVALIGDAIHQIHPIAGQGFNLGLQDVLEISQLIRHHSSLGLDFGSDLLLEEFQKSRKRHNKTMILATDLFNGFFSNDLWLMKKARRLGIEIVNQIPALKKIFMHYAGKVK